TKKSTHLSSSQESKKPSSRAAATGPRRVVLESCETIRSSGLFAYCAHSARIRTAFAIVSGDHRYIDLVIVFFDKLDVARKLDGFDRLERGIQVLQQFFLLISRNRFISSYGFKLFLNSRLRVSEFL